MMPACTSSVSISAASLHPPKSENARIYLKNLFNQLELYGIKSNMQITANGYISSESVSMLYTRLGEILVSDYENLRCVEILITGLGKTVEMRTELSDIAGNKRSIVFAVSKVGDV